MLSILLIVIVASLMLNKSPSQSSNSITDDVSRFVKMNNVDRNKVDMLGRTDITKEDEGQNYLKYVQMILGKLNKNPSIPMDKLQNCDIKEYVDGTIPEQNLEIIGYMNDMLCKYIYRLTSGELHFAPVSVEEAKIYSSGEYEIYQYQSYMHEMTRNWSIRLNLEWLVNKQPMSNECKDRKNYLKPSTKDSAGYPTRNQWIPLPTDVIPSAGMVLNTCHKEDHTKYTIYLNRLQIVGTTLTLEYLKQCPTFVEGYADPTSLESDPADLGDKNMYPYQSGGQQYNKWIDLPNAPSKKDRKKMISDLETRNGIPFWDSSGTVTDWEDIDDVHIAQPVFSNSVVSVPVDASQYQWLFAEHRDIPGSGWIRS